MERGSFYIALICIVSFLPKTNATNRIFSYGKSVIIGKAQRGSLLSSGSHQSLEQ